MLSYLFDSQELAPITHFALYPIMLTKMWGPLMQDMQDWPAKSHERPHGQCSFWVLSQTD